MTQRSATPIEGSRPRPLAGAKALGRVPGERRLDVTVHLRSPEPAPDLVDDEAMATLLPGSRKHLTPEELARRHGPREEDRARIRSWAEEQGLEVLGDTAHGVRLAGSCAALSRAFGVELYDYEHESGAHRSHDGPIYLPPEIAGLVEAVIGLDDRRAGRPRWSAAATIDALYTVDQIADLYRFPAASDGTGQTVAILELGGGYRREDLEAFFSSLGRGVPQIAEVSVDGAVNDPASQEELDQLLALLAGTGGEELQGKALERALWTYEVTMDLELAGALAPGAKLVVYFSRSHAQGIVNGLSAIAGDTEHRPSVLSMSFGEAETSLVPGYADRADAIFKDLANLGVSACASAGDAGSRNGSEDGTPSVNFPASSPYVLACGGTTLHASSATIDSEVVWNSTYNGRHGATGGGVSRLFDRPSWQQDVEVPDSPLGKPGRGVPDIAAVADPATGCRVIVGGSGAVSSGTSAAAPLWAALTARLNHSVGARLGYWSALLYRLAGEGRELSRDVVEGNNGDYQAATGWDPCSGWGTPVGQALERALSGK